MLSIGSSAGRSSCMQRIETRNVIIGAGAMGSAAAYRLARRGEPVLLIEQFPLGHNRGSSHGAARITRHSYADPSYARLMPAAFQAWKELEADAGQSVYIRTGGVSFSPAGFDYVARVAANLESLGVPHRRMRSSGDTILNFSELGMVSLRQVSFGKGEETRTLKPFVETLRVRIPPGKAGPAARSESCVVVGRPILRSVDS